MSYYRLLLWCFYALLGTMIFALPSLYYSPFTETVLQMTIWSVFYFTAFCFLALFMGKMMVKGKDINAMTKLFMVLVFLKLATALAMFLIFVKLYEPEGSWFVMPFIGAYISYTIVEIISLKSLSKLSSKHGRQE